VLKGLYWLLAAMARAARLGLRTTLTVAGRGPIGRFRRLARQLGVDAQVTFLGDADQETVAALYRTSDALVHPTFYDPFPRTIVEALASGCPVITTRVCGGASLIRSGENGVLVDDPRNAEQLVSAIALCADATGRTRMRQAAAADRKRFSFESHAREVIDWLMITQT
jgi:glycosyltransferase involved in cell wall biosynthesis